MADITKNSEYGNLLQGIKERITSARIVASRHVNRELILLYWDIGKSIDAVDLPIRCIYGNEVNQDKKKFQ